jgi:tetratricopeptide (TPR) repeat protein
MEDWGDFGAARSLALKASEKDASKAQVMAILSRVSRWSQNDAQFEAEAIDLLEAPRTSPKERAILLYSMGKYFNDLTDYTEAKKYFIEANRLSQSLYPRYQHSLFSAEIDGLMRAFENSGMGPSEYDQNLSQKPVAIIGMPRCGSSLLEQMLSSHPDLSGVGEIGFFEAMRSARYGHRIFDLPDSDRALLGETYLDQLSLKDGKALRVVDKSLGNFIYAGMIHQILPEAKIIHLKRHPIDTCLSIFCLDLHQVNYSMDLECLAHAYGEYRRLMDFWRHALPKNVLLEVSYEDLVDDPEETLRGVLDFIDLPWDPACLDYSETKRRVGTASNWQVRQGLNRSGIDRWKNYPDLVGPLLHLLD